jgi:hypothetical protein
MLIERQVQKGPEARDTLPRLSVSYRLQRGNETVHL